MNNISNVEQPIEETCIDPLIAEIAELAVPTFQNRDLGMPVLSLICLADLVEMLPNPDQMLEMKAQSKFREIACRADSSIEALFSAEHALCLAASARKILKAYRVIDNGRGPKAIKKLCKAPLMSHDWMKAELLNYAWECRKDCCPEVLGFLVALTHQSGRVGSYCINCFGPDLTAEMFRASSQKGMAEASSPPKTPPQKLMYRGGFASDPSDLASGMCWTEDLAQAAWFADRNLGQKGDAFILSTFSGENETLARFEYECEVVLAPNHQRSFDVVATGELACRSFLRTR